MKTLIRASPLLESSECRRTHGNVGKGYPCPTSSASKKQACKEEAMYTKNTGSNKEEIRYKGQQNRGQGRGRAQDALPRLPLLLPPELWIQIWRHVAHFWFNYMLASGEYFLYTRKISRKPKLPHDIGILLNRGNEGKAAMWWTCQLS